MDACDKLMLLSILAHFPIRSNEVFNEPCTSVLSVDKIRKTEGSKCTCQGQRISCVWNLPYRGLLAATLSSRDRTHPDFWKMHTEARSCRTKICKHQFSSVLEPASPKKMNRTEDTALEYILKWWILDLNPIADPSRARLEPVEASS